MARWSNTGTKSDVRGTFRAFIPRKDAGRRDAVRGFIAAARKWAASSNKRTKDDDDSLYPPNWDEISRDIKRRDGYRCRVNVINPHVTCNRKAPCRLHVHHIIPLSVGGSNHPSNLTTLCVRCHWIYGHDRNPDGSYKKDKGKPLRKPRL